MELLHYVTTRGCGQTTTFDFIQNIQLKELVGVGGGGGGGGIEHNRKIVEGASKRRKGWKERGSIPFETPGNFRKFFRTTIWFMEQPHSVRGYCLSII